MKKQTYLFLIGGIFSLIIAMGIGRFAYTPILPLMQKDLSLSNTTAGYIASSNYAGYLLGAILAGAIPFKKYRTNLLRVSLIISILTTALMGLTYSNLLWNVLRFLSGFASAFVLVLASGIVLDKLAAIRKTSWSGLFYGGVGLGIFLSSLMIPSLNHLFRWEGTWIGLAVVSGILAIFVWIWLDETPNVVKEKNKQDIIVKVPPTKWLIWLIIAYGLEGLGYIVTGTFIVSIAEKTSYFHNGATLVWMMVGLAAIPSCLIWSLLAKKWGYIKSLVLAMALQSLGIAMPVFWMSKTSFVISALLFGATFMGITTLATTVGREMNPSDSSRTIGILSAIYALGQLIGPTLAGVLSSFTHDFNAAFIGAACVVFFGAILLLSGIHFENNPNIRNSTVQYKK
ncbi:YbfB/YjiJ family MFS transporter [Bacillus sp. ISL-101]|uniref:YbfB/YjiJ family MFS transporter n=1 Tax=unclassified Bacillus (in: firmicutes) TaxID=185979 RepID=UPI001BE8B4F6|nr:MULTISPECIES: YbfB/YjiJ family MFS transporter [unclassified Bacillus (in: firmicutes)]MBT2632883.1 YbfB/YjiJ family MFS transporter [Bacillus sp. ISL-101]MBT2715840.1 YbfB/YjiJ family MFS transporter [Bacillus sp. ISL-57]